MTGQPLRLVKKALLFAALTSAACGEHGVHQGAAPGVVHDISEFETIANRFVDNGYAKGIAIALVRGDSVEIRGYGQANEDGAAPDAHTLFEIGSIAKVFTGITLATMVADGEVALEEPLADLVPASVRVPEHGGKPITLLTLATHSSGLPPFTTWQLDWDMAWYQEFLSGYELTRDPGAQYEYSNFGFLLLEDALSMRSKKPCGELVKERVLDPIGMKHTIIGAIPAGEPHAVGHERSGVPAPPLDGECVMSSDATDMAAFVQANLDPPRPLREAIPMAQAEHGSRPDGKIGLAWNIEIAEAPGVLSATGGTMGFRSYLALDGEKQVGVVVLANTSTEAVMALGYALFQMLRGEPHDLALPRLVILSPEALEQCTGRFELEPDFYLTITLERGVLFAQFTEGSKHSIYPSSETTFHYIVDEVRLEFEMGADGRAKRVVIHATDETVPADRVD